MAITRFSPDFIRTNPDLIGKAMDMFHEFEPLQGLNEVNSIRDFVFYRVNHPGMPTEDVEVVLFFQFGDVYTKDLKITWASAK